MSGDILPIFPLPNVVFFPGTRLPLHVFESRYRRMLEDARRFEIVGFVKESPYRAARVRALEDLLARLVERLRALERFSRLKSSPSVSH